MLKRYGDIYYVLKMPSRRAMKIISIAEREENKDWQYRQWLALLPNMTKDNYKNFSEFYKDKKDVKIDTRSKDEIMRDLLDGTV